MSRSVSRSITLQGEAILHNTRMKVEESFSTKNTYLSVGDMNMEMGTKLRTPSQLTSSERRLGRTKSREEGKKARMKHHGIDQKGLEPSVAHWHSGGNSMQWITEATELKDSRSESSTVSQERAAAAIKSSLRDAPQLDAQSRKTRVPRRYRDGRGSSQHCRDTVQQPPKAHELTHVSSTQRPKSKIQQVHPNQKASHIADDKVKVKKMLKKKSERRMRPLPVILEQDDALTVQPSERQETTTKIAKVDKYRGLSFMNCVEQSFKQTYDLIVGSYDTDSSSEDEYSDS